MCSVVHVKKCAAAASRAALLARYPAVCRLGRATDLGLGYAGLGLGRLLNHSAVWKTKAAGISRRFPVIL